MAVETKLDNGRNDSEMRDLIGQHNGKHVELQL